MNLANSGWVEWWDTGDLDCELYYLTLVELEAAYCGAPARGDAT